MCAQTFGAAAHSLARAAARPSMTARRSCISNRSKSARRRSAACSSWRRGVQLIDPVVAYLVAATNGLMYRH